MRITFKLSDRRRGRAPAATDARLSRLITFSSKILLVVSFSNCRVNAGFWVNVGSLPDQASMYRSESHKLTPLLLSLGNYPLDKKRFSTAFILKGHDGPSFQLTPEFRRWEATTAATSSR